MLALQKFLKDRAISMCDHFASLTSPQDVKQRMMESIAIHPVPGKSKQELPGPRLPKNLSQTVTKAPQKETPKAKLELPKEESMEKAPIVERTRQDLAKAAGKGKAMAKALDMAKAKNEAKHRGKGKQQQQ